MSKKSISDCVKAAELLKESREKAVSPTPKGWFSSEDYSLENNYSPTKAKKDIQCLRRMGALEVKKWPKMDDTGRIYHTNIYKLK